MNRLGVALLGTALLSLCPASARAQTTARVDGVAFPGGVADARGATAYIDAASGGVEALALASGAVRWHRPELARPIAVARDLVVALAPTRKSYELRVAVVDATSGKVLRTGETFA